MREILTNGFRELSYPPLGMTQAVFHSGVSRQHVQWAMDVNCLCLSLICLCVNASFSRCVFTSSLSSLLFFYVSSLVYVSCLFVLLLLCVSVLWCPSLLNLWGGGKKGVIICESQDTLYIRMKISQRCTNSVVPSRIPQNIKKKHSPTSVCRSRWPCCQKEDWNPHLGIQCYVFSVWLF